MQIENKRRKSKKKINKIKDRKKRGRKIVGCSVAAEGQIVVDYEDEFDEFGDAKCSLCQRRFEEQGKILPFDMNGISYKKKIKKRDDIRKKKRRPRERDLDKL